MPLWLSPAEYVFWKNTTSPGLSSSRDGCAPLLYSPSNPRLIERPVWRATYQTNPEQSNPLGDEPPHTYAAPRNFSAAPAMPSLGAPAGGGTAARGGVGAAGFGAAVGEGAGFGVAGGI